MNSGQNNKLVSIGLPTYNRAQFLRRALDLLLAQTYKNFELIISDNCSTDDTPKICEEYRKHDARIKYFRQKENIGITDNMSFVLNEARGDYFMWAADDDWWAPEFIEKLKIGLDYNVGCEVAMSSFLRIMPDGQLVNRLIFKGLNDFAKLNHGEAFYKVVNPGRPFHYVVCGLMRTELIKKISERVRICARGDRIIMGEMALAAHFYTLPEILFHKTVQASATSERYPEISNFYLHRLPHVYYIYNLGKRIIFSPVIPLRRKLTDFLPYYARLIKYVFMKKYL